MMTITRSIPTAASPQWRELPRAPRVPVRAALTAAMVAPTARRLGVRVSFPDGRVVGHADPRAPLMRLNRPDAVFHRFGARGPIGLGEAYQAGDWDADDLAALFRAAAPRLDRILPRPLLPLSGLPIFRRLARPVANTIGGARQNTQYHYDLSNDLFALFLDETMTYSSALFESDPEGRPIARADILAAAQRRKIDRLLDTARVGQGTRLLETGTGWGELAIVAARRGAHVHTVTLSANQYDLARQRIAAAGVSDRVRVDLCDYRLIQAEYADGYDAVVSSEMLEGVGLQYWPVYFSTIDRLLSPTGWVGLQTIVMPHRRLLATYAAPTWVRTYIFPGGNIPSLPAIEQVCRRYTRLRVLDSYAFGAHYAETLRLWRERFLSRAGEAAALGFDETFRRTWHLYLAYSEAGFAGGLIDVHQLALGRTG